MAKEKEVDAVELVVAAVPTVDDDALLGGNKDDDSKLKLAVGLDKVELAGVKRILRELQRKCRTERRKVPTPVADAFTLANELDSSFNVHMSMAERATLLNREKKLGVKPGTMTDEWDGSRKSLVDAEMKGTRENGLRELDAFCNSFKTWRTGLLQMSDEWMVKRGQLRTECDEKSSQYHNVMSRIPCLAFDRT